LSPARECASRSELAADLFHLAGLTGLAVAQPLLDLLGRHPTYFVAHRTTPAELLLLLGAICLGIPFLAALIEIPASWIWPAGRGAFHRLLIGLLAAMAVTAWVKRLPGFDFWGIILAAAAAGLALAWTYRRPMVRTFLTFSACLAVVFPVSFLSREAVRKIWQPATADATVQTSAHSTGTRVVLVIFDELPLASLLDEQSNVQAERFPSFAEFANGSHWFVNASSVHQRTSHAVPAILTGCYPACDKLPLAADHPHNLFTWLASDYELHVSEPLTRLYQPEDGTSEPDFWQRFERLVVDTSLVALHTLLPERLTVGLPSVDQNWADFWPAQHRTGASWREVAQLRSDTSDDRPQQFLRFLQAIKPSDRPQLNFIHILLPHVPWCYLPNGACYTVGNASGEAIGLLNLDDWSVVQAYQRHMAQLRYTDHLLGQMLAQLRAANLWEDSLVIVTADHGASFWPGASRRDADATPHPEDILSVPMWIKLPGQTRGKRHARNVETIDILPTIAQVIGRPLLGKIDGVCVFDQAATPRLQKTIFNDHCVARQFPADFLDITASLARKQAIFGDDSSPFWLYRVGAFPEQIGRDVSALVVATDETTRVELDQPALYGHVEPRGPFVPSLISGQVFQVGNALESHPLAVTVNDVLWAVTQVGRHAGIEGSFTALVPPAAFLEGQNRIGVYRIRSGNNTALELVALGGSARGEYRLTMPDDGTTTLIGPDGFAINVLANTQRGVVERIVTGPGGIECSGWAADLVQRDVVDRIVFFQGTRFLASTRPHLLRPEVEREQGLPRAVPIGFGLIIPQRLLDPKTPPHLRAFAITKAGTAAELPQKLWLKNRVSTDP